MSDAWHAPTKMFDLYAFLPGCASGVRFAGGRAGALADGFGAGLSS
jgi:hypothetical protein